MGLLESLKLESDYPDFSMTDDDKKEQKLLMDLIGNPILPFYIEIERICEECKFANSTGLQDTCTVHAPEFSEMIPFPF